MSSVRYAIPEVTIIIKDHRAIPNVNLPEFFAEKAEAMSCETSIPLAVSSVSWIFSRVSKQASSTTPQDINCVLQRVSTEMKSRSWN